MKIISLRNSDSTEEMIGLKHTQNKRDTISLKMSVLRTKKKPINWSQKLTRDSERSEKKQTRPKLITHNWKRISLKRKDRSSFKKNEENTSKRATKKLLLDTDKKESVRSTISWKKHKNASPRRRINTATSFTTTCSFCSLKITHRKIWSKMLKKDKNRSTITSLLNLKSYVNQLRWKTINSLPQSSKRSSQNQAQEDNKMSNCTTGSTNSTKIGSRKISTTIQIQETTVEACLTTNHRCLNLKLVPPMALQPEVNLSWKLKKINWLTRLKLVYMMMQLLKVARKNFETNEENPKYLES